MNQMLDFTHLYKKNNNILYIILVILLSILLLTFIYLTGGTHLGTASIIYIPLFFMVKRYHIIGGLISGVLFGLILWFIIPLDTGLSSMPMFNTAIIRLSLFTTFGVVSGYFFKLNDRRSRTSTLILSKMDDAYCFINSKGEIQYYNQAFKEYVTDILLLKILEEKDIKNCTINQLLNLCSFSHNNSDFQLISDAIINGTHSDFLPIKVTFKEDEFILNHRVEQVISGSNNYGSLFSIKNYKTKYAYENNLKTVKFTDELTGLKNKIYFDQYISNAPSKSYPQGLLVFDIDNFKSINDSLGNQKANEHLNEVSQIILKNSIEYGLCSRYASNEFSLFIPNATSILMDNIISTVNNELLDYKADNVTMTVSSGYHIRDSHLDSLFDILKLAEQNMRLHKNTKSNHFNDNSVNIIMSTLQEKDTYSETHSYAVSHYAKRIALACGIPGNKITEITSAALLHDIGKIIVPDDILQKNSKLTNNEYKKMKRHPEIGHRLLHNINGMESISDIVLSHHERWDGNGYPAGIKGNAIPLASRIISIADSFDAITTNRPYRKKKDLNSALKELQRCSGTQFYPNLIDIFVKNFDAIVQV